MPTRDPFFPSTVSLSNGLPANVVHISAPTLVDLKLLVCAGILDRDCETILLTYFSCTSQHEYFKVAHRETAPVTAMQLIGRCRPIHLFLAVRLSYSILTQYKQQTLVLVCDGKAP